MLLDWNTCADIGNYRPNRTAHWHRRLLFLTPIPCSYPKFRRLGGMARIIIIFESYMETLNHAKYHDWLHFFLPPYAREKKTIWTLLGSNPGRLRGKRLRYPLTHASRATECYLLFCEILWHVPPGLLDWDSVKSNINGFWLWWKSITKIF